jgi:peptidoglycan glycosyltransferase
MNKPIRNLAVACMFLFVALLINATYVQYWAADDLTSLSEHPDNKRVRDAEFSRERGAILVRGKAVAESKKSDDAYKFQRVYPEGPEYAHLTGFFSRDWGLGGVEATENSILSGSDSKLFVTRVIDLVDNQDPKGGSVTLTVNPAAQRAAYDGLKKLGDDVRGAVVAIEPRTGKVLAMVSSPSYNPNRLATHDFDEVGKTKQRLEENPLSPLNNRAIEEVLPPGSTFKLVTAAAALDSGKYTPDTKVPGGATLDLPQTSKDLVNESRGSCGGDKITFTRALQVSCNVSFGAVGLDLGDDRLRDTAEKFGFGKRSFTDLDDALTRQALSRFPEDPDEPQTALSAIGQFDVAATPLQMAMVGAGIANDGVVMKPYLVDEIKSPKLDVLDKTEPEPMPSQPAISSAAARDLTQMMVAVVEGGTGRTAQIPGVDVAGKTGTAQSSPDRPPYAWFVSFAPADTPAVAVAVLVQDAGVARDQISGSGLAAPIAKAVMEAVIGSGD